MIVRTLEDLKAQNRFREKPGAWSSARYLLRDDGVGFTLTQTTVAAGSRQVMQYKNHIEANLIIEGEAILTDCATGETHRLSPGTMYTLDQHDRHELHASATFASCACLRLPWLGRKPMTRTARTLCCDGWMACR